MFAQQQLHSLFQLKSNLLVCRLTVFLVWVLGSTFSAIVFSFLLHFIAGVVLWNLYLYAPQITEALAINSIEEKQEELQPEDFAIKTVVENEEVGNESDLNTLRTIPRLCCPC